MFERVDERSRRVASRRVVHSQKDGKYDLCTKG